MLGALAVGRVQMLPVADAPTTGADRSGTVVDPQPP